MHYVKAKGILSPSGGLNLYRGCQHGCIYCDSRSKCYQMDHAFEDIEVKENAVSLLEAALRSRRRPCMIGTGAMTDPYMPLEKSLGYTRKMLELIEKYGFGATVLTKSDLILRDMDILARINQRTKAVVQMTLTTADEKLCKILEPNVATTRRRIEVLCRFREAGIPTVVWLSPILPFLNDTPENLQAILEACRDAGVMGIINFGMGVTMREGNREYFYEKLDAYFPGMKQRYIRAYGNAYELPSPRNRELMKQFHSFCEANGIDHNNDSIFAYLHHFEEKETAEQLSFL